ncbi:MAG: hypothetical protein OXH84_01080 [Gammaproteobacteria bacterium]|nr:hypothetical protein [Gammaproteobacteria bacterium]
MRHLYAATMTVNGVQVVVTHHIPQAQNEDDVLAFYDDLGSIYLLEIESYVLDEYLETVPGSYVYLGELRFEHVLTDPRAVAGLIASNGTI